MGSTQSELNRRDLLMTTGTSLAALALSVCQPGALSSASPPRGQRILRLAHLTDIHLYAERNAPAELTAALRHIHTLKDQPDLIINGGDSIMDSIQYVSYGWNVEQA